MARGQGLVLSLGYFRNFSLRDNLFRVKAASFRADFSIVIIFEFWEQRVFVSSLEVHHKNKIRVMGVFGGKNETQLMKKEKGKEKKPK